MSQKYNFCSVCCIINLMEVFESSQNYLKRIIILEETLGRDKVRAIDVANSMGFSRASVSVAMHRLEESGYIEFGPEKELILTKAGRYEGERIHERHTVLTNAFIDMGVDPKTAYDDACRVEHDISEETYQAFKAKYLNK